MSKGKWRRKAVDELDDRINEIFRRRCSRVPVSVMDIPKIFRAGHDAAAGGEDVEAAVVATVERLRVQR